MDTIPESSNYVYHLTTALGLAVLIGLYLLGTWSRTFVMPIHAPIPMRKQIIATVPVGCVTMSIYAKSGKYLGNKAVLGISIASLGK